MIEAAEAAGRAAEAGGVERVTYHVDSVLLAGTARSAAQHIKIVDYLRPVFQGHGWKRSQVLAAGEALGQIPQSDRDTVVEMISEPGIDPKSAVRIVETLAEKPAAERREIVSLYRSGEPEKQSLAKTRAVHLPPMPPVTLALLRDATRSIERALDVPSTVGRETLRSALPIVEAALLENETEYQALKKREGW